MSRACTLQLQAPDGTQAVVGCAAGSRVLDAVLDAGWQLPHSCRRGVCASCRAQVLEGSVDAPRLPGGDVLLCQAVSSGDARLQVPRLERTAPPQRLASAARVYRLRRLAPDVVHLELRLPNGVQPHWRAGQSLELVGPGGQVRSYSMARPPQPDHTLHLHVRLVPGGHFSGWLEQALQRGQVRDLPALRVRLPFGALALPEPGTRAAVLLASGTGFSALGAIAEEAVARRDPRPLHLYWGARRKADLYDLPRAQALARAHGAMRLVPVLSEPAADDGWDGRTGWVHRAVMDDFPSLADVDVLACGAPAMLDAAERDFRRERAMPAERWRSDAFHPSASPPLAAGT